MKSEMSRGNGEAEEMSLLALTLLSHDA